MIVLVSKARDWVEPKLVVEGSRGCWWGEKHHCTFCGLNGSFVEFRSKSPNAFYDEIVSQSAGTRCSTLPYRVRRWPWPSFAV